MPTHLRHLNPAPDLHAFYDGRVTGYQSSVKPNWIDDGALSLGIASYALVAGDEAIVYDTHVSLDHARAVREALEQLGVKHFHVVLSHWHLDHVAGTEVFAGSRVIANERTAHHLSSQREAIEAGTLSGPPGIDPLVLPTETFQAKRTLDWGGEPVELIHFNIHSDDGTVLWLPERGIMLAGDTLEDTVTYVDAPQDFAIHLEELDRLGRLGAKTILPNHGDPDLIAAGGYDPRLIGATQSYIRLLQNMDGDRDTPLIDLMLLIEHSDTLRYFEPYETIHLQNVERAIAARSHGQPEVA